MYQYSHVILTDYRFHTFDLHLFPNIETIHPRTSMFHSSYLHMILSHLKLQYSQTLFPRCIYSLSFSFVDHRDRMQNKQTTWTIQKNMNFHIVHIGQSHLGRDLDEYTIVCGGVVQDHKRHCKQTT